MTEGICVTTRAPESDLLKKGAMGFPRTTLSPV